MEYLEAKKKYKQNSEIKRKSKHKLTEMKMSKRKSSISAQKKKNNLKNRRRTIFEQQAIKPISITFRNFPETIKLIKYIKLYKEMNTKKIQDLEEEKMKKILVDKIVNLLKSNKGMFNFFSFYQINEKAILSN